MDEEIKYPPTQRHFAMMGENLFRILNKIIHNQIVCRLLKYQDPDPLSKDLHEDVAGEELIHQQILMIPKIPEEGKECSFIVVVFDKFILNPKNPDYKISTIRFDVICPYEEWIINQGNLRPYLLMQEIDQMFNQAKLKGLGKLQFIRSVPLVLSPQLAGYSMYYTINDFN